MSSLRLLVLLTLLPSACARLAEPTEPAPPAPASFSTESVPSLPPPADLTPAAIAPPPSALAGAAPPAASLVVRHPLDEDHSSSLPSGLFNPMPGGYLAGYAADTGLDIAGLHQSVYAIAAGTLDYAEGGHTLWNGRGDDPFAIRMELDEPIQVRGHRVTHVWYAHLSSMDFQLADGATPRIHVEAGQRLGVSGLARGSPHLHLGMLLDGKVEQEWGTFLGEAGVRAALGDLRDRTRLPRLDGRRITAQNRVK